MKRRTLIILHWFLPALVVMLTFGLWVPRSAAAPQATCTDGVQNSGAAYRICMPDTWNNTLVVYAHAYIAPNQPVGLNDDMLTVPGTDFNVANILTGQGYAFAISSFSVNGLAVLEGVADLVDLVDIFTTEQGEAEHVLIVGVSEGGLVATLAVEQHADRFDGGLAMCAPNGAFRGQVDYFGDFRTLFDYSFPDLMPGSPISMPTALLDTWESSFYRDTVQPVLQDPVNAVTVTELLTVAGAAYDVADASTQEESIRQLLWYNVFGVNDAIAKLGGQPFDNVMRQYSGSTDDAALNQAVVRYHADDAALNALALGYETSGRLTVPLVTMHTTDDPVVPYWQAQRYRGKTIAADNIALHAPITVAAYGHCNLGLFNVINAFNTLVNLVANPPTYQPVQRVYMPIITR